MNTTNKDSEVLVINQNPIIEKKNRYKNYNISLVVRTFEGKDSLDEFKHIKELCNKYEISFIGREYNSRLYYEDCEHITRLPAFHIYEGPNKRYVGTFYDGTDPFEIINSEGFCPSIEKIGLIRRIINRLLGYK